MAETEITCLCCEGQGTERVHDCPNWVKGRGRSLKPLCRNGKHYGHCEQCRALLLESFEEELKKGEKKKFEHKPFSRFLRPNAEGGSS